jgi:hypothetical protein
VEAGGFYSGETRRGEAKLGLPYPARLLQFNFFLLFFISLSSFIFFPCDLAWVGFSSVSEIAFRLLDFFYFFRLFYFYFFSAGRVLLSCVTGRGGVFLGLD